MGFLSGRVTFARFKVDGPNPDLFDDSHLDRLREHGAGRQRVATADGVEVGWSAGGHLLDTAFSLEKNVVNGTLAFALRVDVDRFPGDLLRAYTAIELKAMAANNPSGMPSARQKREAKEAARQRIEDEAKDGRFKKRKSIPVLWDGKAGEVLFGAVGLTHVDRMTALFRQTFGADLVAVTAGRAAVAGMNDVPGRTATIDTIHPSGFHLGVPLDGVAWVPDTESFDFLGNEYLLWLWFTADSGPDSDTLKLSDGSEATYMIARTLTLECPRGQTGHETIRSDGPTRLPEARRAVQAGKLPRKCGLTVVRHDRQYEFTLSAETLAVGSAKLPPPEEGSEAARRAERVDNLRHLIQTLDLMYAAFLADRLSGRWPDTLRRMQRWLGHDQS